MSATPHRRRQHAPSLAQVVAPLALAALAAACTDERPLAPEAQPAAVAAPPAVSAAVVNASLPGRTLAANCFQCHGTNGYASELKIAGESAREIISELNEMRAKDPRGNIMNVHAAAYTPAEITLIANYFAAQ